MHTCRHLSSFTLIGLGLLCGLSGCSTPKACPVEVVMIVGGEYHDYDTLPHPLAQALQARGDVHIDVTNDLAVLDSKRLADVDVLLFNTCHQETIESSQREAVMEHLERGGGLIALHCSLWSYQDWPEWQQMVGGFAPGHDKYSRYDVTVLDPWHPVMLGVGRGFEITDEPYIVEHFDPNANVLIRTSRIMNDMQGQPRPGHEPQVWTKDVGNGRMLAVTFGHDERSQTNPNFVALLHNGIRWTARRMPDTAHNVLTEEEQQGDVDLLFNGKDLTGWEGMNGPWTVEDGCIVGRGENLKHHQYLTFTGATYSDFELRFSVRLEDTPGANSGVQFRSARHDDSNVTGYQADIARGYYGSLYEVGGPRALLVDGWSNVGQEAAILDGWNDMIVRATGGKITVSLNGLVTAELLETLPDAPTAGVIALQLHQGPPMTVRFRDIRIRRIKLRI